MRIPPTPTYCLGDTAVPHVSLVVIVAAKPGVFAYRRMRVNSSPPSNEVHESLAEAYTGSKSSRRSIKMPSVLQVLLVDV
jgi:hypothetical protein